jgi:hypothetical protein
LNIVCGDAVMFVIRCDGGDGVVEKVGKVEVEWVLAY